MTKTPLPTNFGTLERTIMLFTLIRLILEQVRNDLQIPSEDCNLESRLSFGQSSACTLTKKTQKLWLWRWPRCFTSTTHLHFVIWVNFQARHTCSAFLNTQKQTDSYLSKFRCLIASNTSFFGSKCEKGKKMLYNKPNDKTWKQADVSFVTRNIYSRKAVLEIVRFVMIDTWVTDMLFKSTLKIILAG